MEAWYRMQETVELTTLLQKFANDPSFNVHQIGFSSYIANHIIKEKDRNT
jgi:hypothetical protein